LKQGKLIDRLLGLLPAREWTKPVPLVEQPPLADPEVFSTLYTRTHLQVFRYIYGLRGGPLEDVEDLTAETYTRAWNARFIYHGEEQKAIGWLLRIARSQVIDAYRRSQARIRPQETDLEEEAIQPLPFDLSWLSATPEGQVVEDEKRRVLLDLLQGLPAETRELLVLRYFLGWRVRQIGEYLDIPENTVSVYIRRALERLRNQWPADDTAGKERCDVA
jgi:RNA polymerase sigma-70 factor (ECF subfamily)